MSTEQTMKGNLITDQALIKKYKDELRITGVYIPPQRDESTMDMEAMKVGTHAKSMDMVGQQSAVSITINENDPDKESLDSLFRTHKRLADGVHRWRQTESKGKQPLDELEIKFYAVKDFEEYTKLKALLDTKKADNPAEKKLDIEALCESMFKNGTPKEKVSAKVKQLLEGIMPESTLNDFIPEKFKEKSKQRVKPKTEEKVAEDNKDPTKHEQQLQKLVAEITELTKENTKLTKEKDELKSENKQLTEIISLVKLEKTVKVEGAENLEVAVSYNPDKREYTVRKA